MNDVTQSETKEPRLLFSQVLEEEYEKLHVRTLELPSLAKQDATEEEEQESEKKRLDAIYAAIHGLTSKRSAVCFSGGGIRSATVGLGVLQSLSRIGLLQKFDFLSTVSGGGYIGSWLSAWVYRHPNGIEGVCDELNDSSSSSTTPEPPPIGWLRSYSNYLSPKLGWFSADSWTLIGTYLRNLILNWLVLIPILIAILALPRLAVSLAHTETTGPGAQSFVFWSGVLCAIVSLLYLHLYRPSLRGFRTTTGWDRYSSQSYFLCWCLAPLVLSAFLLTTDWAWYRNQDTPQFKSYELELASPSYRLVAQESLPTPPPFPNLPHRLDSLIWEGCPSWIPFVTGGAALHSFSWLIAFILLGRFREDWLKSPIELGSVIATGAVGGGLIWLGMDLLLPQAPVSSYPEWYGVLAVPGFIGIFLFAATLYIGISSRLTDDHDREWWGRSGSWTLLAAGGWGGLAGLVVLAPSGLAAALSASENGRLVELMGGTAGILSALTAVLFGSSAATSATQETGSNRQSASRDLASKLAAPIFILIFLLFLAILTSQAIEWGANTWECGIAWDHVGTHLPKDPWHHINVVHNTPPHIGFIVIGIAGCFGCFWAFFININKFSLHSVYRNRLIRAYLGASRSKDYLGGARCPDQFTDFDVVDNIQMSKLADPKLSGKILLRPFHIVNIALNLVNTKRLDWQQRKAQSFTVSALHSGNLDLGYRSSKEYGRNNNKQVARSISLGTALAISGAAASPNMGYHSSPVVTLLLTLFNVRLGWWLGNPGKAGDKKILGLGRPAYQTPSPRFAVKPLLAETFGKTDSDHPYVNLSDGGHFENLGLYEMVLRRCHFILVVDAACDPTSTFQDLGNAIRKIRIDQGIDIDINLDMLQRPDNSRYSQWHHAIGTIRYDKVDRGAPVGTVLYIKASLTGDEPPDIEEYAKQHIDFPHESTADQFFDESQFESYRRLGQHMGKEVLRVLERSTDRDTARVCSLLRSRWIGNPPGIHDSFLRETQGLIQIERTLREDPTLSRYDLELYPELQTLFGIGPEGLQPLSPRATLHFCNEQVQLMENVFLAVKLDEFHAHPLNRGWMNLFRRWTATAQFRALWPTIRGTYSRPFVNFAECHLNLEVAISILRRAPSEALRLTLLHEYGIEWPQQLKQLADALDHPLPGESGDSAKPAIWLAVGDNSQSPKDCWGIAVAYEATNQEIQLTVWIRLAYRNLGIGSHLLKQALEELKQHNAGRALVVDLGPDDPSAKGFQQQKAAWLWFYEQAGFTRDRPEKKESSGRSNKAESDSRPNQKRLRMRQTL